MMEAVAVMEVPVAVALQPVAMCRADVRRRDKSRVPAADSATHACVPRGTLTGYALIGLLFRKLCIRAVLSSTSS